MKLRRRHDREKLILLVLWLVYGVAVLASCSPGRWYPTDPRVWPPQYDPDNIQIVDRVTIGPDGIRHVLVPTVTPFPTAIPAAVPAPWIRRSR